MKEIVIISGKGGTGKTSITAAFAALSTQAVFADCDVDAADMHLLLAPLSQQSYPFISGNIARIDAQNCTGCDTCNSLCRFDAVRPGSPYTIIPSSCEGCGVCVHFCPEKTIEFPPQRCGQWYQSETRFGSMVHAALDIGAENSGKLVSLVRQEARNLAEKHQRELILIDGPPGIGCPVIAATTGANAVLVITEPTCSGKHDLLRVLELTNHFDIPAYICVNKWDINPDMTEEIKTAAQEKGATFVGTIPYDEQITTAQIEGKTIVEWGDTIAANAIKKIWNSFCEQLDLPQ
ncbi:MAG: ATP-binding protein [Thermodesulfobacteriota bacterium]|nr:ATP-binding protein [Thermodesulfobacteriota bacterium]